MIWRSSGEDDGVGDLESQQAVRCALQHLTDDLSKHHEAWKIYFNWKGLQTTTLRTLFCSFFCTFNDADYYIQTI